jgi:hypothetical protein
VSRELAALSDLAMAHVPLQEYGDGTARPGHDQYSPRSSAQRQAMAVLVAHGLAHAEDLGEGRRPVYRLDDGARAQIAG